MKQTAYFSEKPDVVTVCVLPTGASDVWLRRNIVEKQIADTTDGEAMTQWECEEVYARNGETDPRDRAGAFRRLLGRGRELAGGKPRSAQRPRASGGPGGRNGRYAPGRR